jgi:hypothetical protein
MRTVGQKPIARAVCPFFSIGPGSLDRPQIPTVYPQAAGESTPISLFKRIFWTFFPTIAQMSSSAADAPRAMHPSHAALCVACIELAGDLGRPAARVALTNMPAQAYLLGSCEGRYRDSHWEKVRSGSTR